MSADTIVAVATAPGRGAVGIVRLSGDAALQVAAGLVSGALPAARSAVLRPFLDEHGTAIDAGLVLCFPGPGSYTGEDSVELHAHGAPVVLDLLVHHALQRGARIARPGEFTERAFLNGKLDLAQAEAVADLIAAGSEAAARAAARSLDGAFSDAVNALAADLATARAFLEASIDFADEESAADADSGLSARLQRLAAELDALLQRTQQGVLLNEGLRVVLCGPPNVGKSSLLNALAGREAALVTDVPGTTRDVIREALQVDGLALLLMDTAGLRESDDPVERLGVSRSRETLESADLALLVAEDSPGLDAAAALAAAHLPGALRTIIVRNKIDLSGAAAGRLGGTDPVEVRVSARTGAGLADLRACIHEAAGYQPAAGEFMARRRHLWALQRAAGHTRAARVLVEEQADSALAAEELRLAQQQFDEIVGRFGSEDLLGLIFSSFCIGK